MLYVACECMVVWDARYYAEWVYGMLIVCGMLYRCLVCKLYRCMSVWYVGCMKYAVLLFGK